MRKQSKTNWDRVDSLKESEIDYSDSSKLGSDFFAKAVRWPGAKQLISLRLDPDILAFFKKQGRGYQTTINALLRRYMEAQQSSPSTGLIEKKELASAGKRNKARKKSA
jgi:uncharacterized protein (DUF4415 family)